MTNIIAENCIVTNLIGNEDNILVASLSEDKNIQCDITIAKGDKGDTPVKGIDYYTEEDKNEMREFSKTVALSVVDEKVEDIYNNIDKLNTDIINIKNSNLELKESINNHLENHPQGFSGDYNDLINKPNIPTMPNLEEYATKEYVEFKVLEYLQSFTVRFIDDDGNVLYTTKVLSGGEAKYIGETPTKPSDAQYHYIFKGWDKATKPILSDTDIKATFSAELRYYTVRFINSDTQEIISSQYVGYGNMPIAPELPEGFNMWDPSITEVDKDMDYYTKYMPYPNDLSIFSFTTTTIDGTSGYICTLKSGVELPSSLIIPLEYQGKPVVEFRGYSSTNSYKDIVTEVLIPSGIKTLGNHSFREFKNLTNIEIPNGVTSLGNVCFGGCSRLTSIKMPNSVTAIGSSCFNYCNRLTSMIIGKYGSPILSSDNWNSNFITSAPKATVTIFTLNGLETDLTGSPWGGTNCTFIYEQA